MTDYDHATIEPTWQQRWEESGLYRAEVDWDAPKHYALTMLPYPQRRSAHRALVRHDALRRPRPLHADEGLQRPVPDGLRRLRPARRERRHPAQHPPGDVDPRQHRAHASPAAQHGHDVRLGARDRQLRAGVLPVDTSGSSSSSTSTGWPTAARRWSTGRRRCRRCWRTSRSSTARTSAPGSRWSRSMMTQWFFAITKYADELLELRRHRLARADPRHADQLDRPQRGRRVAFHTEARRRAIEIFTTRPDTLWGATFMVLPPEHPLVDTLTTDDQRDDGRRLRRRRRRARTETGADGRPTGTRPACSPAVTPSTRSTASDPDLDRRLRADDLRHRRDHGSARPRPARLRVRPQVRLADGRRSSIPPGRPGRRRRR